MDRNEKTEGRGFFSWLKQPQDQSESVSQGSLKGRNISAKDDIDEEIDLWTVIEVDFSKNSFEDDSKEINSYKIDIKPFSSENPHLNIETKKTNSLFSYLNPSHLIEKGYQAIFAPKKEPVKFDFHQCKSEVINKALNILPEGLSEELKEQFRKDFEKSINLIDPEMQKNLQDLSDWFDHLPKMRQKQIELLKLGEPHPLVIHEVLHSFQKACEKLNTQEMSVGVFLQKNLFDVFERIGPMNNQITEDSFPQMIFHPRYIVENSNRFPTTQRELLCWGDAYKNQELEMGQSSLAVSELVNDHYQLHSISNFVYSKITWHMEEGKVVNKDERLFKKGYMELSLAIPTAGDIRTARVPLDLTPFHLDTSEAITIVGNIFKHVNGAGTLEKQKDRLNEMLALLSKLEGKVEGNEGFDEKENSNIAQVIGILPRTDETFQLIKGIFADEKTRDLFVQTVLRHNIKSEEILTKLLIATGDPTVHFDDVQETGDKIPQGMINNLCEKSSDFKEIWADYQRALGNLRDQMIVLYMNPKIVLDSQGELRLKDLAQEFFKIEKSLLKKLKEQVDNPQDVKVVNDYLDKVRNFNTSMWNEDNFSQLQLMNKVIEMTEKVMSEGNKENLLLKNTYQIVLYPFLADRESLRVFIDWLRVYKIDHKENRDEELSFPDERLKQKSQELLSLINGRHDLNQDQKEMVMKLLEL